MKVKIGFNTSRTSKAISKAINISHDDLFTIKGLDTQTKMKFALCSLRDYIQMIQMISNDSEELMAFVYFFLVDKKIATKKELQEFKWEGLHD